MTLSTRYISQVKNVLEEFDPKKENRYILFGSAARKDSFGDIDIGVLGNKRAGKNIAALRERFEESTVPYVVDVVDFDDTSAQFRDHVLSQELVWLN